MDQDGPLKTDRLALDYVSAGAIIDEVMGFPVPRAKPLMDVGLDSLIMGDLMRRFSKALGGADLPPTLFFDYPNVDDRVDRGDFDVSYNLNVPQSNVSENPSTL